MNKELKIEHYLLQLDQELRALTVSQRAEIITEVKKQIAAREATTDVDTILSELGAPRAVAERYLAARGVNYAPAPQRRRWVKRLAIGTVIFFGLVCFAGLSAIWYFSPLVKVDEQKGRIVLLGGLIDVDEKIGKIKIGDMELNGQLKGDVEVRGEEELSSQVKMVRIPFNTAKLDLAPAEDRTLRWDCRAASFDRPAVATSASVLTLNLEKLNLARCSVTIPAGVSTEVRGVNGHMDVSHPGWPLDIVLDNGKVNITPDPQRVYDFQVRVKNGLQDFFPRSNAKDALKVKVSVVNGLVKKE